MTKYGIDTCAMLVEFSASMWTARKLDKSTTDEVVVTKNAGAKDAARVNKHLLAGRPELDVIQKHVNAARTYVHSVTLPWSDTGIRLLPTAKFMEFEKRIREEELKYWEIVDSFVAIYPSLITAQAMALGDMFKRDEFPSAATMRERFAFSVNYMPVPTAGDWRVDVGNEAQEDLRARLETLAEQKVAQAMDDVRLRLKVHLQRMSDRLTVDLVGGEAKPRKFHDTLVESGFELVDLVKALNITHDPDIETVRKGLEQALAGVTPKELRENMDVRKDVKRTVDDVLDKFSW